jgi:hypothetical protein
LHQRKQLKEQRIPLTLGLRITDTLENSLEIQIRGEGERLLPGSYGLR